MRIDGWAFLGLVACQGRDRRSGGGGIGASRIGGNVLWSVSGRIARRFFVLSRSSRGGFGSGFAILVWVAWAGLGWVRVSVVESGGWRDGVGIWEFAPALVCVGGVFSSLFLPFGIRIFEGLDGGELGWGLVLVLFLVDCQVCYTMYISSQGRRPLFFFCGWLLVVTGVRPSGRSSLFSRLCCFSMQPWACVSVSCQTRLTDDNMRFDSTGLA